MLRLDSILKQELERPCFIWEVYPGSPPSGIQEVSGKQLKPVQGA